MQTPSSILAGLLLSGRNLLEAAILVWFGLSAYKHADPATSVLEEVEAFPRRLLLRGDQDLPLHAASVRASPGCPATCIISMFQGHQ